MRKLGEGVEAWNAWRAQNPELVPDLEGADLSGRDLPRIRLDDGVVASIVGEVERQRERLEPTLPPVRVPDGSADECH